MITYTALAIPLAALKELRDTDDAGHPLRPFTASDDGVPLDCVGSPLRCCLRGIEAGEGCPVSGESAAALSRCAGRRRSYDRRAGVDPRRRVRARAQPRTTPSTGPGRSEPEYDAGGTSAAGASSSPRDAQAGFDRIFEDAFTEPGVALVHVRAVEYGCFQYEVRRP